MRKCYSLWLLFLLFIVFGCVLELPADKELKACSKPSEITVNADATNALLINLTLKGETADVLTVVWRVNNGNVEVSRSKELASSTIPLSITLTQLGIYEIFADIKTTCGESFTLTKSYKTCLKPTEITTTNDVTSPLKVLLAISGSTKDVTTVLWRINNSSNIEVARSQELTPAGSSISMALPTAGSYTVFADVKTTCSETVQFNKPYTTRNCAKPTAVTTTADAANPLKIQLSLSGITNDVTKTVWKVTNSNSVETTVSSSGTGIIASVTLPAYGIYAVSVTVTTSCGDNFQLTTNHTAASLYPEMTFVEGGTFEMGSNTGETQEKPAHNATVSSYWISKHEVTVKQYREFCTATGYAFPTETPAWGWQDDNPIVFVSWDDATAYCSWLAQKTGKKYRLPTEAEWEFAAKGGLLTQRFIYAGGSNFGEVAWYYLNSGNQTRPVGGKKANELGLYDMSGNVWEWCMDWHGVYPTGSVINPQGPSGGTHRSVRSGAFDGDENYGRITFRLAAQPSNKGRSTGFRCVQENN